MRSIDAGRLVWGHCHEGGLSEALDLGGIAGTGVNDGLTHLDMMDKIAPKYGGFFLLEANHGS